MNRPKNIESQQNWLTEELKGVYQQGSDIEYDPLLTEKILASIPLSGYQDKARVIRMRLASVAAIFILVIMGALGGLMLGNHLTGLIEDETHPSVTSLMDETYQERIEFILTGNEQLAQWEK